MASTPCPACAQRVCKLCRPFRGDKAVDSNDCLREQLDCPECRRDCKVCLGSGMVAPHVASVFLLGGFG